MKNYVLIIALLLFVTCNLTGTYNIARVQDKNDTLKSTVKKTTVMNEWKITKKENKDKTIGKTKDGKIIYEGPRGGRYYMSDKGKKVYIKKN
jgi:colicin import membrane protein